MGSPLGPLMANAFMCKLESQLEKSDVFPQYYRRYVDDTIAVFPSLHDHQQFFAQLNDIHPNMTFTFEMMDNNSLPFIGVNIISTNSSASHTVYHKPTDTGLLLHFHSNTDTRYKHALLRTMLTRAYRLSSSWKALHEECLHLRRTFLNLCYPANLIDRMVNEVISSNRDPPSKSDSPTLPPRRLVLPFKTQAQAAQLRKNITLLNGKLQTNIQPVFTSVKLKEKIQLREQKEPLVSQSRVVYQYKCSCDMSYVGYTCRHLHQRVSEHQRSNSSIYQHCFSSGHSFSTSRFTIIARCTTKLDCQIREAMEIYYRRPQLNSREEYVCSLLHRL